MNPIENPYSPGAGSPPPELAGRTELRSAVKIAISRIKVGNPAKSLLLVGLRGVGKTVLLDQMCVDAEEAGIHTIRVEAPENRSLPALLAPNLRSALLRLSRVESAKEAANRALKGLAGFAKALKFKYHDIEMGFDFEPEVGLADNGDLELDLTALLEACGQAAKSANTALVLFIDELQYVKEPELAALISALHRCSQKKLPVCVVGAGLPQLRARAGNAKSYAERLFDYPEVGPLSGEEAKQALERPAVQRGVSFIPEAVEKIVKQTKGYPYFIQEWGKHAWDIAAGSPITVDDVDKASELTVAALDESFFLVRFDRLTPLQKMYLRAMAELGPGPHRSGDIAELLQRKVTALGPTRNELISKGMVWSPNHGDTAFTVPLFDEFMKRIMPDENWNQKS